MVGWISIRPLQETRTGDRRARRASTMVVASVAEDNILQIWQMAENIYLDDKGLDLDKDDGKK